MNIEKRSKKRPTKEVDVEIETEVDLIPKKQRKDTNETEESDDDVRGIYLGQNDWVTRPSGRLWRQESISIQRKLIEEKIEFQHVRVSGRCFIVRTEGDLSNTKSGGQTMKGKQVH
ncbi:hypothetical protein SeMB42_g05807 [Synchytrium endobioticum]|uniref:Uncharacterized protein n=1 Tax=Synchytrium endobioticum TaxID=286115 RepID=A0A507CP97_9FUNG|nr:hypothetical protein SeMB42_g05807 [Synchytrium endobioticum]